jgi:formate hydrogenlyase subunit 6/NADH:ubiquinone oxidoreductase subunit I
MLKALLARAKFGNRTIGFPDQPPALPERFQGRPVVSPDPCTKGCSDCAAACPTSAIEVVDRHPVIDLGRCLFCGECERACRSNRIHFSKDFSMAASKRSDLVVRHGFE